MAVSIIESTGIIADEPIQQRSDKSAQKTVFAEEGVLGVICPRFIYLKLGNLEDNKSVEIDHFMNEHNEYEFFIMEMERYSQTGIDDSNIAQIDEYLGGLGLDFEYPFADDTYDAPELPITGSNEPRNVSYTENGVTTNVTYDDTIVDYNVLHNIDH